MYVVKPFGRSLRYFPIGRKFVIINRIKLKKSEAFSQKRNGDKYNFNSHELINDDKHILKKKILNLELNDIITIIRNHYPDDVVSYCLDCFGKGKFSIRLKSKKINKFKLKDRNRKYTITRIK